MRQFATMDGILIIDKPKGWTSYDVINFIRKRFGIRKVGHTGTLDPIATGVLVLLLGRYTRFSEEFMCAEKGYKVVLTMGTVTDTGDSTGKVVKIQPVLELEKDEIEKVLKSFTGEIEQVPPMFSAIKVKGERLYKLARQGKEIERKPRKVVINKIQLESFRPGEISMCVVCSKGTYMRTLCEDIAKALRNVGHMSYLRRIRSGNFSIEQAVTIERLKKDSVEDLKNLILAV